MQFVEIGGTWNRCGNWYFTCLKTNSVSISIRIYWKPAKIVTCKGSSRIVIIFTRVHIVCWGEGVKICHTLVKMLIMMHCIFIRGGVAKINIFKYSFGREGGGPKNEYSVYAFDNVDNYGRPLIVHKALLLNCTLS